MPSKGTKDQEQLTTQMENIIDNIRVQHQGTIPNISIKEQHPKAKEVKISRGKIKNKVEYLL